MKFKSYADELLQMLSEGLMTALKSSLGTEANEVEMFALNSLKRLQKKPESVE